MIKVRNLTKKFGSVVAIDDISFSVARGETIGILGPNGAGKTTLMRILSGYLPATTGTVLIDGLDMFSNSLEARRNIGYLPENVALYSEMRVGEYLRFRSKLKNIPKRKRRDYLNEVKKHCDLKGVDNKIIGHLSRGYWQRIGLADSLVHHPALLLLDEPTVGLDPGQIRKVREMIRKLGRSYTIVLSTHFLTDAETLCQRVLILNKGRMIAFDSPRNLMRPKNGTILITVEIFGPCLEVLDRLAELPNVRSISRPADEQPAEKDTHPNWHRYTLECTQNADVRPPVAELVIQRRWQLRELKTEKKSLEEAYLEITRRGNSE